MWLGWGLFVCMFVFTFKPNMKLQVRWERLCIQQLFVLQNHVEIRGRFSVIQVALFSCWNIAAGLLFPLGINVIHYSSNKQLLQSEEAIWQQREQRCSIKRISNISPNAYWWLQLYHMQCFCIYHMIFHRAVLSSWYDLANILIHFNIRPCVVIPLFFTFTALCVSIYLPN